MRHVFRNDPTCHSRIKELLEIQVEQLDGWKSVLKDEVYEVLKDWVALRNRELQDAIDAGKEFDIYSAVKRGTDMDYIVSNYILGHRDFKDSNRYFY